MVTLNDTTWKTLNELSAEYQFITDSSERGAFEINQLYIKLSELEKAILKAFPNKPIPGGISLYIDTLEVDQATTRFQSNIIQLYCREILITTPNPVINWQVDPENGYFVTAYQMVTGGNLTFKPIDASGNLFTGAIEFSLKKPDAQQLSEPHYAQFNGKGIAVPDKNITNDLTGIIESSGMTNLLQASFQAGSYLLYGKSDQQSFAYTVIRWVNYMTGIYLSSYPKPAGADPESWPIINSLASQTASLILMDTRGRAEIAVPLLSTDFYSESLEIMANLAQKYDEQIQQLSQSDQLAKTFENFSTVLKQNQTGKQQAHIFALNRIYTQKKSYQDQLITAKGDFEAAQIDLQYAKSDLDEWVSEAKVLGILSMVWDIGSAVASVGMTAGEVIIGDEGGAATQVTQTLKTIKNGLKAFKLASSTVTNFGDLTKSLSGSLKEMNLNDKESQELSGIPEQLSRIKTKRDLQALSSVIIWNAVEKYLILTSNNSEITGINDIAVPHFNEADQVSLGALSIEGVDPVTYWDDYELMSLNALSSLLDNSDKNVKYSAQSYETAFKEMINYAKSYAAKQNAILTLQGQAMNIIKEIEEDAKAVERWQKLSADLQSGQQASDALKSIMFQRYAAIKRTLFVEMQEYRAAWLYWYISEPKIEMRMDMSIDEIMEAVNEVHTGMEALLKQETSQDFKDAALSLKFSDKNRKDNPGDTIYQGFKSTSKNNESIFTFSIPVAEKQLVDQIESNALYISEAQFFLEGIEEDETTGEILLSVETNAYYTQKRGNRLFQFVSEKGMKMEFAYKPTVPPSIVIDWKPSRDIANNYMKPSPFTTWKITVKKGDARQVYSLKMKISGRFINEIS